MPQLPPDALTLLTTSGFDKLFFSNLRTTKTQVEAYEKTEKQYHGYFGRNRYSNYDSYRNSRNRRLKAK